MILPTAKLKPKAKVKEKPPLQKRAAPLTHEQVLEDESRLTKVRIVAATTVMTESGSAKEGLMTKMGPKILKRFGYLLNKENQ